MTVRLIPMLAGLFIPALLLASTVLAPRPARAHCDTMDGPVVAAARAALERGDLTAALPWVHAGDEAAIREAFQRTLAVRRLSAEAKELADRWFFETLVRIHRQGEGAPFTGLKPAGTPIGEAVEMADRALESGDPARLVGMLAEVTHAGIQRRFVAARQARERQSASVEAGRHYVAAYVEFVHYVERLHQAATTDAGHDAASGAAPAHAH
jgi:hypothetical protein